MNDLSINKFYNIVTITKKYSKWKATPFEFFLKNWEILSWQIKKEKKGDIQKNWQVLTLEYVIPNGNTILMSKVFRDINKLLKYLNIASFEIDCTI